MKHIIDTDELEKLPRYEQDKFLVRYEDVVKLIANSPQADEAYGQDFHLANTCTRIRRLLKLLNIPDPSDDKDHVLMGCLFALLGSACRIIELSQETAKEASARAIADHNTIMELQADDVRKDAERWKKARQLGVVKSINPFISVMMNDADAFIDQAIDKARE